MAGLILFCFFFIFGLFSSNDAIRCFDCQNIPYPRDCSEITECDQGEHCFTEQVVTTSGNVVYNTGCSSRSHCSAVSVSLLGKRSGHTNKRSTDLFTCFECCEDSFCNREGCGVQEIPLGQRGLYCFNCYAVLDPRSCEKLSICQQNEVCLLYTPTEFLGLPETIYRSQCEKQSTCDQFQAISSSDKCTVTCCNSDFCNDQCVANSNFSITTEATSRSTFITTEAMQTTFSKTISTDTPSTKTHLRVTTEETTFSSSSIWPSTSKAPFQCHQKDGYMHIHSHHADLCVHIVTRHESWTNARRLCQNKGGDLVVLDTPEKAALMRHTLDHSHEYSHHGLYWIGATGNSHSGSFHWVNNHHIDKSAADWGKGQPDTNVQDCVTMDQYYHYKWNNRGCSDGNNYICERK